MVLDKRTAARRISRAAHERDLAGVSRIVDPRCLRQAPQTFSDLSCKPSVSFHLSVNVSAPSLALRRRFEPETLQVFR